MEKNKIWILSIFLVFVCVNSYAKNKASFQLLPYSTLKKMTLKEYFEFLKLPPTHDPIVIEHYAEGPWPGKENLEALMTYINDTTPCSHVMSSIDPILRLNGSSTIGDQSIFLIYSIKQRGYPVYSSEPILERMKAGSKQRQEVIDWAKNEIWWQKFWKFFGFSITP